MAMNPRLLRPRATGYDPAAQVYFNAVAVADGQQLEPAVKKAINDFVVGCKADGTWSAIKASCILMGARTLSGALTPLVGAAPTNNGPFVSGDYNRKTGLVGNGTSKYLDTNRATSADPQNSRHAMLRVVELGTQTSEGIFQSGTAATTGRTYMQRSGPSSDLNVAIAGPNVTVTGGWAELGNFGLNRSSSSNINWRIGTITGSSTSNTSVSPATGNYTPYYTWTGPVYSAQRLAFYSFGEAIDLALLGSRVSALYAAIGAAIP